MQVIQVNTSHLERLQALEMAIQYQQKPPGNTDPFVLIKRDSPVLVSAPHGARTYRNSKSEKWHEEDEYTAGMALLLAELCGASVIATTWKTVCSDPNFTRDPGSPYKQAIRKLSAEQPLRLVIDLHGAGGDNDRMAAHHLVDLGTRQEKESLPPAQLNRLVMLLERQLGTGTVSHNGFPAYTEGRTITAFCHGVLHIPAVQVEMKPPVRVVERRAEASSYPTRGPYTAPPELVLGILQALADFIHV